MNVPLVLHGGSGISDEDFRHCIDLGVRKINIATASMDAAITFAGRYMAEPGEHDYYHFNENVVQGVYENVKHCIKVFNNKEPL